METNADEMATYLVDSHVHFHDCFDGRAFLDGAAANFRRAAHRLACGKPWLGCLLLADMAGQQSLGRLLQQSDESRTDGWNLATTEEGHSVAAIHDDGSTLVIVGGQQIVCRENIEILALACDHEIPHSLSMHDALDAIRGRGVIPVLPWGFGKWWFRRGADIRTLVQSVHDNPGKGKHEIFLGDNGGRPQLSRQPRLFRFARQLGVRILPGTDPLPLASHAACAGRYGFVLQGKLNLEYPAHEITRLLHADSCQPAIFGRRTRWSQFCWQQMAIRFSKLVR